MLDVQVFLEKQKDGKWELKYEYYEKPVTSKMVMMKQSAMGEKCKVTTLTQETIRRMINTCRSTSTSQRAAILSTTMMSKMKASGYSSAQRLDVLTAGCKGYYRMVAREQAGGRRLNRPAKEGEEERKVSRVNGAENWFQNTKRMEEEEGERENEEAWNLPAFRQKSGAKTRGKGRKTPKFNKQQKIYDQIEGIMFCPITPKGELAKRIQKDEDMFAKLYNVPKIKIVERGGRKLSSLLCRADPFQNQPCGRGAWCVLASRRNWEEFL